ncbi:MAG: dihydrodipicolinate synthase family protein [Atribacterota bacterium]|nr:dihydrodipicolinate synthase family protein [Atribacterota bacterium]
MFKLEGIYPAMLTAFDDEGKVDEMQMRKVVDFQIENGVEGLFPNSSLGEFIRMSSEEKKKLIKIVFEQANGRVPVVPGACAGSADESIAIANYVEQTGGEAVVVCPPYYITMSQAEIIAHYKTIADNINIPLVLYNIPQFTNPIGYEVVKELAGHPNVIGMKDSGGNMVDFLNFLDIAKEKNENFSLFTGQGAMVLSALQAGGKGSMTGDANYIPEVVAELVKSYKEGNLQRALKIQFDIIKLQRVLKQVPFSIGFKLAMKARGIDMGKPKQPLSSSAQQQVEKLEPVIKKEVDNILNSIK